MKRSEAIKIYKASERIMDAQTVIIDHDPGSYSMVITRSLGAFFVDIMAGSDADKTTICAKVDREGAAFLLQGTEQEAVELLCHAVIKVQTREIELLCGRVLPGITLTEALTGRRSVSDEEPDRPPMGDHPPAGVVVNVCGYSVDANWRMPRPPRPGLIPVAIFRGGVWDLFWWVDEEDRKYDAPNIQNPIDRYAAYAARAHKELGFTVR